MKGNIWVYGAYKDVVYDKDNITESYCDPTCYRFAFWTITSMWILIGLFGVLVCVICVVVDVDEISSEDMNDGEQNNKQQYQDDDDDDENNV